MSGGIVVILIAVGLIAAAGFLYWRQHKPAAKPSQPPQQPPTP